MFVLEKHYWVMLGARRLAMTCHSSPGMQAPVDGLLKLMHPASLVLDCVVYKQLLTPQVSSSSG